MRTELHAVGTSCRSGEDILHGGRDHLDPAGGHQAVTPRRTRELRHARLDGVANLVDHGFVLRIHDHLVHPGHELLHVGLDHATGGHSRSTHTDARGNERTARVKRHHVLVDGDVRSTEGCISRLSGDVLVAQVVDMRWLSVPPLIRW